MRSGALVAAGAVVALLGLVFSLQGFGALQGSSMSDTTTWSVAGPVIVLVGLAAVWFGSRKRP